MVSRRLELVHNEVISLWTNGTEILSGQSVSEDTASSQEFLFTEKNGLLDLHVRITVHPEGKSGQN